jgi:hypothetical protein
VFGEDQLSPSNFMPRFDGLPRDAKRKGERELFKNGKLRSSAKQRILSKDRESFQALLTQFPMRERDADVLLRYMIGDATKEEADNAFYASLRDPKWMAQWFRNQRDQMLPIINWLRAPAEKLHAAIAPLSEASRQLREAYRVYDKDGTGPDELSSKVKVEMRQRWLQSITTSILASKSIPVPAFDVERLQKYAPGLVTSISTANDMAWSSASEMPRKALASDFVDAVHSMYAPYVDIYRTDAFMAPLISQYVKSRGTAVVGKLNALVGLIESRLKSRP